ncbi:DNA repair protein RecN [Variovorax sp. OAS795]
MALRRIALRDFVIVRSLELDLSGGFTVLTGETGAGKSILIDALQLALGNRADAGAVREGAERLDVSAEFDADPAFAAWLDEGGFESGDALLLRRTVDLQGRSRGWINGCPATATQLRELGDRLLDIHGQHAWQSLTRPEAVRGLLDAYAGVRTDALDAAWQGWRQALSALDHARSAQDSLQRERERLQWQIAEVMKLAPAEGEWDELSTQHARASNAQALIEAAQGASQALEDDDSGALAALSRAVALLQDCEHIEPEFRALGEVLASSVAQASDAAHSLHGYLRDAEADPQRLAELDERMGLWMSLARRYKRTPGDLPSLLAGWQDELKALDAQGDLEGLERAEQSAQQGYMKEARALAKLRKQAAPRLAEAVTKAMQGLGMQGGRFEVELQRAGAAWPRRPRRHCLPGERASGQHAAPHRQGGFGRGAVPHRPGDCGHHEPARHRADADLRRGRCGCGRGRGRDRGTAHEAARARPPGAGRDPSAAGGGLRRSPPGGFQAPDDRGGPGRPAHRKRRRTAGRRQPRTRNRPHARRREGLADFAGTCPRNAGPQDFGSAVMALDLVLITGMSGSGKSVALHALEDAGYYCVDNLPPELLTPFIALQHEQQAQRVAIAMDVRSGVSLPIVPQQLDALRQDGVSLRSLFLDATTDALLRRYSETRRRHPLSRQEGRTDAPEQERALVQAIELERELLADLRDGADVIDTSLIRPAQLQSYIKALISAPQSPLTLVFESFAFKRGVPLDADYVFDVRMLPNPHYVATLRPLTGRDAPVIEWLREHEDVARMYDDIEQFLSRWLDALARDHRSYVTVAIGCTGGQHRSVFLVEQLARAFGTRWGALKRHRELDAN